MIGHQWAVDLLAQHIRRQRLRHAYLFTGPQGVGRRTLALRFAQAINCPQPRSPARPCGVCRSCQLLERMQHPDLAIVQAEQVGKTLKVEQVRELERILALHPYESTYRIALLLRFEEAHPSAMNALLKTLEEPASRVILLLTAESPESLLPTITSRCEVLRLRPVSTAALATSLQAMPEIALEQAQLLARLAGGRPGYALRLHQSPDLLEQRLDWLQQLESLLTASRFERFDLAESISKDKDLLRGMFMVWLSFWRDVLLQAAGTNAGLENPDYQQLIHRLATALGTAAAFRMVQRLEHLLNLVEKNVNPRLAIEVLFLDLPQFSSSA